MSAHTNFLIQLHELKMHPENGGHNFLWARISKQNDVGGFEYVTELTSYALIGSDAEKLAIRDEFMKEVNSNIGHVMGWEGCEKSSNGYRREVSPP